MENDKKASYIKMSLKTIITEVLDFVDNGDNANVEFKIDIDCGMGIEKCGLGNQEKQEAIQVRNPTLRITRILNVHNPENIEINRVIFGTGNRDFGESKQPAIMESLRKINKAFGD